MLKYEGIAIGTKIKAYDFEPSPERTDRYVTGLITDILIRDGAKVYVIECKEDPVFDSACNRVGLKIYVPMETFLDFDNRITIVVA